MTALQSRAPANTMLMGEHAVVYGQPALVAALDQWLTIDWTPLNSPDLIILSELANHHTRLAAITPHPKLGFVCDALNYFLPALRQHTPANQGWQLNISSDIGSNFGLGSSAAVLAACLVGLNQLSQQSHSLLELWQIGRQIIRQRQGRGSAADLAASLFGGVVYLQPETDSEAASSPARITPLNPASYQGLSLGLVYAGYKTPTADVLAWVADHWQDRPTERDALYHRMGAITQHAYQALEQQAWLPFYAAVTDYQDCMAELGVSDATLEQLLSLADAAQLGAAKVSGSGLGDCIIVFSDQAEQIDQWFAQAEMQAWSCFSLPITSDGADMIAL